MRIILTIMSCLMIVLVSCSPATENLSATQTAFQEAVIAEVTNLATSNTLEPTITSLPTDTPIPPKTNTSPSPSPTQSPTQSPTSTPSWGLKNDFNDSSDGVLRLKIIHSHQHIYHRFPKTQCPIEISSYQADLMVVNTNYSGPNYSAYLDLHGIGTIRSWYVQLGYHYSNVDGLKVHCHAYSYSSDPPRTRFWQTVPQSVRFDEWHSFKIEVVPTDNEWGYSFLYLLDGIPICEYKPPLNWDGDHRYNVIFHGVDIYADGVNRTDEDIELLFDNYYGFESPTCGS